MTDDELRRELRRHAYLEGDFVLRSGRRSRYYLDKYRFETRPELLAAIAERIGATAGKHSPGAARLAGTELGAGALAAAASLATKWAFLHVRREQNDHATGNRIEGLFEPGEEVCLVEDVVTSGGAAAEAVRALRAAGLECRVAVCVVDREEGGVDELARLAVRLCPLFRVGELLEA